MKSVTCDKLIKVYQTELLRFLIFDPDVNINFYSDQIRNAKTMLTNLDLFIYSLDCSIDRTDYNRILDIIGIYREKAFSTKDSVLLKKCNSMITRLNSKRIDEYNLYIRKTIDELSLGKSKPYIENIDVFSLKKIFEMNLGIIKMLLQDDLKQQVEQIDYLSRNELYFYGLNFLFDNVEEVLYDLDVLSNLLAVTIVNKKKKNNGIPLFIENPRVAFTNRKFNKKIKKLIKKNSN